MMYIVAFDSVLNILCYDINKKNVLLLSSGKTRDILTINGFILSITNIFSGRLAEELRTEQEHGMASDKNLKILSSQSLELQRWFSVTRFYYNGA